MVFDKLIPISLNKEVIGMWIPSLFNIEIISGVTPKNLNKFEDNENKFSWEVLCEILKIIIPEKLIK